MTKKTVTETAEEQAAGDAALLAALQERDGELTNPTPRPPTFGELFVDNVTMIADLVKSSRLSQQTVLKTFELTLMWVLNTRQQREEIPSYPVSGDDYPGPHEVITADADETEETE